MANFANYTDSNISNYTGEQIAPLEALFPKDLNPTLRDICIECYLFLIGDFEVVEKIGLNELAELVMGQIERVALSLGGAQFYLPKDIKLRCRERNLAIVAEYNGLNRLEIMKKYRLSDMRIRQIFEIDRRRKLAASK